MKLKEKFEDFSKMLISIEKKFNTTAREIYIIYVISVVCCHIISPPDFDLDNGF